MTYSSLLSMCRSLSIDASVPAGISPWGTVVR